MDVYNIQINIENDRSKLVEEYKLIFSQYPDLERLARAYWEKTANANQVSDPQAYEEAILSATVIEMSDILLESDIFVSAMALKDANLLDNAIIESLAMIDIVPDL